MLQDYCWVESFLGLVTFPMRSLKPGRYGQKNEKKISLRAASYEG